MGHHECNTGGGAQVCGTADVNYVAFHEALVAVSKHDNPNYKVDLQTRLGLVRIVFALSSLHRELQASARGSTDFLAAT